MRSDLTKGSIGKTMMLFALPMIAGNALQQVYNITDTLIIGRALGSQALAAVGAAYPLMVFLTSVFIGLCMGSGVVFSIYFGKRDMETLRRCEFLSFVMILSISLVLNICVYLLVDPLLQWLAVPEEITEMVKGYLLWIFSGILAVFLFNFSATVLRSVGNSVTPLIFLGISAALNIALDCWFILGLGWGITGAAFATVIAQWLSGIGLTVYLLMCFPELKIHRKNIGYDSGILKEIMQCSLLTCIQQSVMNFGILMIQGLVNSFGTAVMAAFAAAVKIDSFAYMPAQEFGNAFSTFIAQNYGAAKRDRIKEGIRSAVTIAGSFCLAVSLGVFLLAEPLMKIFIDAKETEIISIGMQYLRIEGACYIGIGILFLLYGLYRAVKRPEVSLLLTIISLGTRVLLAYTLAPIHSIGVTGIWWSVPIGWALADMTGFLIYRKKKSILLP